MPRAWITGWAAGKPDKTMANKPLLIIKTGHTVSSLRAQWEDFEDWIAAGCGLPEERFSVVSVFKDETLPPTADIAGVIITGSPSNVTEHLPWMESVSDWLRGAVEAGLPVLGICFGHQLLAYALGGEVAFHSKGREIGTVEILLTEAGQQDVLLNKLPVRFRAQVSHSQTVVKLPADAVILAGNEFEHCHGVRYRERVWGLQFHPEFTSRIMAAYLEERRAVLESEGLDYGALWDALQETPAAAALLARFAAIVYPPAA